MLLSLFAGGFTTLCKKLVSFGFSGSDFELAWDCRIWVSTRFSPDSIKRVLDTEVTCSLCYAALGFVGLSII